MQRGGELASDEEVTLIRPRWTGVCTMFFEQAHRCGQSAKTPSAMTNT